jgi:hypothetical protein
MGPYWFSNIETGEDEDGKYKNTKALTVLGGGLVGGLASFLRKEPGEEITILVLDNFGLVLALRLK